jgi:hypothetical protein
MTPIERYLVLRLDGKIGLDSEATLVLAESVDALTEKISTDLLDLETAIAAAAAGIEEKINNIDESIRGGWAS